MTRLPHDKVRDGEQPNAVEAEFSYIGYVPTFKGDISRSRKQRGITEERKHKHVERCHDGTRQPAGRAVPSLRSSRPEQLTLRLFMLTGAWSAASGGTMPHVNPKIKGAH